MRIEDREFTVFKKERFYIAFDGTEFKEEWKCRNYEFQELLEKMKDELVYINELEGYAPSDGCDHNENNEYHWFFIRNKEDYQRLEEFFDPQWLKEEMIGQNVCFELGDDCTWAYAENESIEYAQKLIEKLGHKIVIERKEEAK